MCTANGTIFDLTTIIPWIKKHGTNPVDGTPLKSSDLIKLNFAKNDAGEYVDPVTFKAFTDNTHIVALRPSGNVFAWDTIERLNIKPKMWRDLVSDHEFGRKDIITLQDPQNLESRNLNAFKYLQDGESGLTDEQKREREENVNLNAMGSSAKILKAKEAVAKARAERTAAQQQKAGGQGDAKAGTVTKREGPKQTTTTTTSGKPVPYNAARHTTGLTAASLTSTGLTPRTATELATLTDEQFLLKRGRVKNKGYVQVSTTMGDLNIELHTDWAPKAVWNFIQLAKKGYYRDVIFHRNIKGFMIQGGDPTGTGRGGQSIWGKNFEDEFQGPYKHNARGTVSMANKGKNTNSSQLYVYITIYSELVANLDSFIAYRALPHLDNKHTVFGRLVDDPSPSSQVLNAMELVPVDPTNHKPTTDIRIKEVTVLLDPFEEFMSKQKEQQNPANKGAAAEQESESLDDQITWTGKRVRTGDGAKTNGSGESTGVGKYLKAALAEQKKSGAQDEIVESVDGEFPVASEPVKKKARTGGGFGNFEGW